MNIYNYHPVTGEFLNESEARVDPLDPENHLIPADATTENPPTGGQDETPVFDGGTWILTPDHRGKICYVKDTREAVVLDDLGDIPATLTKLVPTDFSEWDGGQWVIDKPAAVAAKTNICNNEAERRISLIMPDWMNRRHREQKDLVTKGKRPSTKLPEAEYELKQEQCDAVRDASDTINDWIESHADPASISNDEIVSHMVWH